jgi:hypothetical protein
MIKVGAVAYVLGKEERFVRKIPRKADIVTW